MSSSEDEVEFVEKKANAKGNDSTISLETSSSSSDDRNNTKSNDSNENESDEDESSQPSGAECLELCKKFAEITETDRALAM